MHDLEGGSRLNVHNKSLASGRPTSFHPQTIDCQYPVDPTKETDGGELTRATSQKISSLRGFTFRR